MSAAILKFENLPKDWTLKKLGQLVKPTRPRIKPAEKLDLPFLGMDHIEAHTMRQLGSVPAGTMKSSSVHFQPGDVLYGRLRPYLNKVYLPTFEGLCSAEFIVFPEGEELHNKYLQYFLNWSKFVTFANSLNSGDRPRVKYEELSPCDVPVPPLEQQKRIVAKIEELFSHIDAGIAALNKAKQLLKQYRQSVLKAAVTGELTKEWREENKGKLEPASQLLERILKERRHKWEAQQLEQFKAKGKMPKDDKWKGKYKEPFNVESEGELIDLPSSWQWICLDSLIVDGPQNGIYLPKTKYGSGIPIIRIDDFQDAYVRPYEELQKVQATDAEIATYQVSPKSLVINRVNSLTHLGKCLIIKDENTPCLFESNMMKADITSQVEVEYLDYYIQSKFGRKKLIKNAKWAVNQASINQQDVRNMEITLPPYEEQRVIVSVTTEKLDSIKRLETDVDAQLKKAEKNKQSILASAFSGALQ